ncbi:hypothetical protein [Piscinibacter koreensis]|uniref:Penicillin-binding protein transpeptidase domain-containing protein n=1 Tax=Piscinibacter koreensis TaxID=2742824 RepID=A0A7Y6NRG9_9BURK|nr:hypothetical protein [Schlegelella koreensis]NUZ07979.1 hypothetical protein [Schlegelella koreensis]
MGEPRGATLLDFAIGASVAVVPVMFAIVLGVSLFKPADPDAGTAIADGHVSVRQLAALKTFEVAVVARSAGAAPSPSARDVLDGVPACRAEWRNAGEWRAWAERLGLARPVPRPPSPADRIAAHLQALDAALRRLVARPGAPTARPVGLDAARWFAAARDALAAPVQSASYPGQPFRLGCADLAAALGRLVRGEARMLESLPWRGREGPRALATWGAEQQMQVRAQHLMRRNPWRGIAGCIYFGRHDATGVPAYYVAGVRSVQRRICGMPALAAAGALPGEGTGGLRLAAATLDAPGGSTGRWAAIDATTAEQSSRAPQPIAGAPDATTPPGDPRWAVPPSLDAMLQPLEALRQPSGPLYRLATDRDAPASGASDLTQRAPARPNRIQLDGAPVDVGFSIDVTIEPRLQALAQQTAACYTGRHDVCEALGLRRSEDAGRPLGDALLEGAMVRMAAIAIVDVASGRIEALAGARSPCAQAEVEGRVREPGCDGRVPHAARTPPDGLLNPALFHDAMPASTIKPIMAAAFLGAPDVGARWLAVETAAMQRDGAPARDSLRGQLLRSDSARFLDRMFCLESGLSNCARAAHIQAAASAFGWNAGCVDARGVCGTRDLLFGSAPGAAAGAGALMRPIAYGRLLSEPAGGRPGAPMRLMALPEPDRGRVARCAAGADGRRGSDDDWEKCRGGALVDVVAEGWGQGHARASALGVAGMMATLASAANGAPTTIRPHLVDAVRGVAPGRDVEPGAPLAKVAASPGGAAAEPHGLSAEAARVIVSGLSYSHRIGTARSACLQVLDAPACQSLDSVAGKTGTPSFPADGMTLDELGRLCAAVPDGPGAARPAACGGLRPYKWYVAAYRQGAPGAPWTKAIAVLTERNWLRRSGQVHGTGDHGPNPAAEIALQIVARQIGLIGRTAP